MFRSPQPGDWAADDVEPLPTPAPAPVSPPPAQEASAARERQERTERRAERDTGSGRFGDRSRDGNAGRFERDSRDFGGRGYDRDNGRFDRDRDGGRFDRGGRYERDNYGRDRDYGRYERDGGRFDREGGRYDRDGGRYDRDGGRFERDGGRFEREGGRSEGGRADPARWGHNTDRRTDFNDRRGGRGDFASMPVEQGFVVSIKESFGFVSSMERDGDLFFHISEAPVDVQLQDEVEFRVKYNQRSDKEMACQLVTLPKGTIVVEDVSEEFYDGVVTKSLPRGGHGGHGFFNNRDDGRQREEGHGLIEISKTPEKEEDADKEPAENEAQEPAGEEGGDSPKKTLAKREFVRFNSESVASSDAKTDGDDQEQSRPRKSAIPHFGDEVHFRIAKHRKTGAKRAVDITITVSARDKLEKEIEAKLATMTRETGVVERIKGGGGFIKCCDRPVDLYFPFHEVREPEQPEEGASKEEASDKPKRGRQAKPVVREGDEVSFFVYEDQEDDSARSRPRLTALRVQKLPAGTVSFEKLVRADVEGLVSKTPKEPRNAPEVIGAITPTSPDVLDTSEEKSESAKDVAEPAAEGGAKPPKKKKGKDGKPKKLKLAFRLCDTDDMSYVPHVDDKVLFDQVLDKRTGKMKAVKVRVLQLNPKNRETGVITAMKEDFGFIKCAERSSDAYFRFSDVMGSSRNFGNGTEVAFDVVVDNKSDHVRASRLQILPRGTVKWEDVAAEALEGTIVAVPSSRRGHSTRGGRGDKMKQFPKFTHGKITFATPTKQHLVDFLPELKEKIDSAFLTSETAEKPQEETEAKEGDEAESKEIRVAFPSSLSKFERAALHEYSDWLGLRHESSGEGAHRQLEIVGDQKVLTTTVEEKLAASPPELTVEFREDDVEDVRYNPHVGDRVKFDLVVLKRTKQFQCTKISCIEAASAAAKPAAKAAQPKTDGPKSEGLIVSVKPEGFGFIQPVSTGAMEENLFFHINEITTGQTLAELKEGTEVQFTVFVDEKKKRKRAVAIAVVPAGTIKNAAAKIVKGVVAKPSFLNRMKGRFTKGAANKSSTLGKIRLVGDDADDAGSDDEDDEDEDAEEGAEDTAETEADAEGEAKKTDKKAAPKKTNKQVYLYNIRDIADQTVVLREGDEVEFIPQITPKLLRAAQVRLVVSHAKQGVVTQISEDFGGIVRLDGDEDEPVDAQFSARNVLRGDILNVGDRVEFAYRLPSQTPIKSKKAKKTDEADEEAKDEAKAETEQGEAKEEEEAEAPVLGHATSILRLSASQTPAEGAARRGSRSVNSTLKEAMRQVGANAMVASRMAKGPDGTRGFTEGWNTESAEEEAPAAETETTVTAATTDETEA